MRKITPFLWFDGKAEEAANFYASIFKNSKIGAVTHYGDSGPGAKLGGFRGMAVGIGPEIGFIIPLSKDYQGYLNLRGYKDLETENRANTWSTWVTFAISPAPPEPTAKPVSRK